MSGRPAEIEPRCAHPDVNGKGPEIETLEQEVVRLKETVRSLEEHKEEKDCLFHMIIHEINNPVCLIAAQVDLMKMKRDHADSQRNGLTVINRNATRTKRLIEDLLTLSRTQTSRFHIDVRSVDVNQLVEEILTDLDPRTQERQIDLKADLAPHVVLETDPVRLTQIIMNLVDNALKFTPPGGSIMLSCNTSNARAMFKIEDTGPGVPVEDAERIFRPFEQTDHGQGKGSGLGLYITKQLVEALGGRISLERPLENGAAFVFDLPLFKPPA